MLVLSFELLFSSFHVSACIAGVSYLRFDIVNLSLKTMVFTFEIIFLSFSYSGFYI